jgi:hypothetical protein
MTLLGRLEKFTADGKTAFFNSELIQAAIHAICKPWASQSNASRWLYESVIPT